jgi:hypothetical protein
LAVALEMSVMEMALGDWARGRILDGACLVSADVYFGKQGGLGGLHVSLALESSLVLIFTSQETPN